LKTAGVSCHPWMMANNRGMRRLSFHPIRFGEIKQAQGLFCKVFGDQQIRRVDFLRDLDYVYNRENLRNCVAVTDRGRLVAHTAGRPAEVLLDGAVLKWASYGHVMARPEYRGCGVGTRMNRTVWGWLRKRGADGVFISGSRGLYLRMGAVTSGNYYRFRLETRKWKTVRPVRLGLSMRPGRLSDIADLVRLHRRERTGFIRKPVDFASLLRQRYSNLSYMTLWMIFERGRPVAYAALSAGKRPHFFDGIMDYAGSRAALFFAIPALMRRAGMRVGPITVSAGDDEFLLLLRSLRFKESWSPVIGVHVLLDPIRLISRLRPYFLNRLGSEVSQGLKFRGRGHAFEFSFGRERFRVRDLKSLTLLVMGDCPEKWDRALPGKGALGGILKRVFPIPFPIIGLNWI